MGFYAGEFNQEMKFDLIKAHNKEKEQTMGQISGRNED